MKIKNTSTVVSGSCFWGHKWTKWEQYAQKMFNTKNWIEYFEYRQKRTCVRCGKVQDELVS